MAATVSPPSTGRALAEAKRAPVPDSSNAQTEATSPRAERPRTIREFERAIRSLGFSQAEAKTIAAKGFNAIAVQPTPDEVALAQVLAALQRIEGALAKETK